MMDPGLGSTRWTSSVVRRTASAWAWRSTCRLRRVHDGRRIVATVSRSTAGLWRVPIGSRMIDESGATPLSLPTTRGLSPRAGHGYIIYRAPKAGTDGLVKIAAGTSTELWTGVEGRPLGGPAIAPDGQRLAFVVQRRGSTRLYVMNTDGTGARRIAEELDVRGAPAWSPDGQWLAIAANSGWEAPALQDSRRRRDADSARERVRDRSNLVSERTVSRLLRRGCGHELLRECGECRRRTARFSDADSGSGRPAAGLSRWGRCAGRS